MRTSSVNPPLIAIIGPTGSGKSTLALKLAKKFHGYVISADSQQIFKRAAIGTNQPAGRWSVIKGRKRVYLVQGVPHYFIDSVSPNRLYSAARFQRAVSLLIDNNSHLLHSTFPIPFLVGGTMLYTSAVIEGYSFPKGGPNMELRAKLEGLGTRALQQKLKRLDPITWQTIDQANRRRLIRALEHVLTAGTSFAQAQQRGLRPNTLVLGLAPSRATLRRAIERRTRRMFRRGLVDEVRQLGRRYPRVRLLQSIGYREVVEYLNGNLSRAQAEQRIVSHTWQYARRQLAWFKKIPNVHWIKTVNEARRLVRTFLNG